MGLRAEVFIAATSADLGSYRQVAKEAVLTLGAHPIEEKTFPTDYRELQALLAHRLDPCDVIIHLVGFYYGGEPKAPPDTPRRSWTQWEYYHATQGERQKPVYRFLARENCHFDAQPSEDAEKQRLQREHREHLRTPGGPIYYEFSTPEELRELILSIDELRELVRPRRARIPFLPMREKFTGRCQLLKTLQQDLTAGTAWVVAQPVSVYADGGVGKTALAAELGWRLFESHQFDFVLFLNASTPETLDAELASLCASDALDLPEQTAKEQENRLARVMRWLGAVENARRTFLILDNADADEARQAVRNLLPKVIACAVLITSRFGGALGGVHQQELTLFHAEESREYLHTHLQPGLLAASGAATLDAVSDAVGHLPLALELVVSYMHETRQSPSEWLTEWRKSPAPTLVFHDADTVNYPVSLARVWKRSVGRLSPSARDLLYSLAWMAPRPATLSLEGLKVHQDWRGLRAALSELAKVSLIAWPHGTNEISIHRVLQAVTCHSMSEKEMTASLKAALAQIEASLPDPEWNEEGWQLWEQLASHCRALLDHLSGHVLEPKGVHIMSQYGVWLHHRGQYTNAEAIFQRALAIRTNVLGKEHSDTLTSMNNLAQTLYAQGDLAVARTLQEQVLRARARLLGKEHPNTLTSMNNLAQTLYAQGDLAGARRLEEQVLEAMARLLGKEHPNTLTSMNNLAQTLYAQGDLAEARTLQEQVLGARARLLGKEHPDTLTSMNDLAQTLYAQGDLAVARTLQEQVLEARARLLGKEHPDTLTSMLNLAQTCTRKEI
jgi:tetratricopeptide (TPR) repeat protein